MMLSNTRPIRKRPPSYKRKTVGSTSRTTYVAKMNAEVTSRTSETRSVSVPTGMKTLNRRIIEGAGCANSGKVNYTGSQAIPTIRPIVTKTIYLDYHATTPVDPRVLEAMLPFFGPKFGNAASGTHSFGWEAEAGVEVARKRIAELAGAAAREIVFTSGATEADNLALKGVVAAARGAGTHIVTVGTEHKAVLDPASTFEAGGCLW